MTWRKRIAFASFLAVAAAGGGTLYSQVAPPTNDPKWACFVTWGAPCGCQSGKCLVNCYCP